MNHSDKALAKADNSAAGALVTGTGAALPNATPDRLRTLKILADFTEAQLENFLRFTEQVFVKASSLVVLEGEPGDAMFLIVDGELRARAVTAGKELTLATMGAGAFFGEVALLDRGLRSADVVANRDSLLLKLSAVSFEKLRREAPELALAFLMILSRSIVGRVRSMTKRYEESLQFSRFGDYELIGEIARGGVGVIYKAKQVSLNRVVALKMLLSGDYADPKEIQRFHGEIEAAAALQHPNIVAIHEVGEHEGRPFFSMEYVDGPNLHELASTGPLEVKRAAKYVQKIAAAIHYAHQQGILHRDLKPSNILIDPFDEPRITDFGLAKRLNETVGMTVSGQMLGTPNYLPPEQISSQHGATGPVSDVYSLGAILYRLLTGRPPFQAETIEKLLVQVMQSEPPRPRLLNQGIPRDLETICLKCLEKASRERYPSAGALAEDLGRFLRGDPIAARPPGWLAKVGRWCFRKGRGA